MLAWLNVYLIYRITMSMHAKNKFLETRTEQEPNKRFRNNLADLFLAGGVSALRTTSLFRDAAANVSDPAFPDRFEEVAKRKCLVLCTGTS